MQNITNSKYNLERTSTDYSNEIARTILNRGNVFGQKELSDFCNISIPQSWCFIVERMFFGRLYTEGNENELIGRGYQKIWSENVSLSGDPQSNRALTFLDTTLDKVEGYENEYCAGTNSSLAPYIRKWSLWVMEQSNLESGNGKFGWIDSVFQTFDSIYAKPKWESDLKKVNQPDIKRDWPFYKMDKDRDKTGCLQTCDPFPRISTVTIQDQYADDYGGLGEQGLNFLASK